MPTIQSELAFHVNADIPYRGIKRWRSRSDDDSIREGLEQTVGALGKQRIGES